MELEESIIRKTLDVNVISSFFLIKEVLPYMPKEGNIIFNTTSGTFTFQEIAGTAFYCASKFMLQ